MARDAGAAFVAMTPRSQRPSLAGRRWMSSAPTPRRAIASTWWCAAGRAGTSWLYGCDGATVKRWKRCARLWPRRSAVEHERDQVAVLWFGAGTQGPPLIAP